MVVGAAVLAWVWQKCAKSVRYEIGCVKITVELTFEKICCVERV